MILCVHRRTMRIPAVRYNLGPACKWSRGMKNWFIETWRKRNSILQVHQSSLCHSPANLSSFVSVGRKANKLRLLPVFVIYEPHEICSSLIHFFPRYGKQPHIAYLILYQDCGAKSYLPRKQRANSFLLYYKGWIIMGSSIVLPWSVLHCLLFNKAFLRK